MNRASMKQVLFVQLPPPRFSFAEPPTNIPLAAGFLAAAIDAASRGSVSVEILASETVDVLGDQALLAKILDRRPAVLAMTLYVWNVTRSLFLAANVKRLLPRTKILVGGPEVTADNAWVMRHPAVDAGVFGEGESRIVSVLQALCSGQDLSGIPGTFCKDGKTPVLNPNARAAVGSCCRGLSVSGRKDPSIPRRHAVPGNHERVPVSVPVLLLPQVLSGHTISLADTRGPGAGFCL